MHRVLLSAAVLEAPTQGMNDLAKQNTARLQALLDRGGWIVPECSPGMPAPLYPVRITRKGTVLDLRWFTAPSCLYVPTPIPGHTHRAPLITVSGCSARIIGGQLFAPQKSGVQTPLLSLRRDGGATDPGVWIEGTWVWGHSSGPLVETVGAECVTFDGCHVSQDGTGVAVRLSVDGSSTRTAFVGGCYLSNYGGGDVAQISGDVQEVAFRDCYMAGVARGVVTVPRSPADPGEVSGLFLDNVRFEGPGPAVDTSATWLAESSFRGVSLGPGPGDPKDRPVVRTRANARNVTVDPTCRHMAGGPVALGVSVVPA